MLKNIKGKGRYLVKLSSCVVIFHLVVLVSCTTQLYQVFELCTSQFFQIVVYEYQISIHPCTSASACSKQAQPTSLACKPLPVPVASLSQDLQQAFAKICSKPLPGHAASLCQNQQQAFTCSKLLPKASLCLKQAFACSKPLPSANIFLQQAFASLQQAFVCKLSLSYKLALIFAILLGYKVVLHSCNRQLNQLVILISSNTQSN